METILMNKNELQKHFRTNIKNILNANNMTQRDLVKKIDITDSSLSCYISGKKTPSINVLYKMATVLDVKVDDLISDNYKFGRDSLKDIEVKLNTIKEKISGFDNIIEGNYQMVDKKGCNMELNEHMKWNLLKLSWKEYKEELDKLLNEIKED